MATTSPRSTPPPPGLTDGLWRDHAACRNHPRLLPSAWDDCLSAELREATGGRERRVAAAKQVCRTECPVRDACLADVDLDYDEGIRGGEDLRELKETRRRGRTVSA